MRIKKKLFYSPPSCFSVNDSLTRWNQRLFGILSVTVLLLSDPLLGVAVDAGEGI